MPVSPPLKDHPEIKEADTYNVYALHELVRLCILTLFSLPEKSRMAFGQLDIEHKERYKKFADFFERSSAVATSSSGLLSEHKSLFLQTKSHSMA